MDQQNEELLKRIAKLVRQNQELIEHHERLTKETTNFRPKSKITRPSWPK